MSHVATYSDDVLLVKSGRISRYFTAAEMRCNCASCRKTQDVFPVHWKLMEILERIRREVARPVHVRSGHRCLAHNAAVGGVEDSHHLRGEAADIHAFGCDARHLADLARRFGAGGVGIYEGWIHADVGPERVWWG